MSAALDPGRVLQNTAAAVLRLRHQARAALLDGQVPGARRQFGDRRRRTVLREQRTRHRHGEPERRELPAGRLRLRGLRLLRLRLRTERLTGLAGLRLTAVGLARLRGTGARVAVTTLRLTAVRLRGGGLGGGEEGALEGRDEGVAIAAPARASVAIRLRMRPVPAPMVSIPPLLSKPPAGSKMLPSALQAANTVKAMPNGPRSRPATFGTCGRPWATTISAAPMMPANVTLRRTGPLPQAFGMLALSAAPSIE